MSSNSPSGSGSKDVSKPLDSPEWLVPFKQLGPQIYFYHPMFNTTSNGATTTPSTASTDPSPNLIIICSWMGASARHIAKYTSSYVSRYPSVPTLLVRCTLYDAMIKPTENQLEAIKPAITAIQSVFGSLPSAPRVLFHIFSNGGSWTGGVLTHAYKEASTGLTLPITALVLDSCPSLPNQRKSFRALSVVLPKFFIFRILGSILILITLCIMVSLNKVGVTENLILRVRRILNDPTDAFIRRGVPRVYICSKSDAMVGIEDVKKHAEQAKGVMKQMGLKDDEVNRRVQFEEFIGSAHVGHLMVDKDRYWRAVKGIWIEGVKVQDSRILI